MAASQYWRTCRKVVCIGRNYADHAAELGNSRPSRPFFFLKPPSSILPPHDETPTTERPLLQIPNGVVAHHEVELALVMSKLLVHKPNLSMEEALSSIEGYALGIDMTARNVQEKAKEKKLPWTAAKGFDTFLPMSNLIHKSKIPDPHSVRLWLSVNGHMRQDGSTSNMIFQIPRLLSEITSVMRLEPNDIILTGTPSGVGPVKPGDIIDAGLSVNGEPTPEGSISVEVQESAVRYQV